MLLKYIIDTRSSGVDDRETVCSRLREGATLWSKTAEALTHFLARLLLRSVLTDAECEVVQNLGGRFVALERGADAISVGQSTTEACLVVDGLVARFDQKVGGERQYTALYLRGDMCDLHSIVVPIASWGIEALTKVTLLMVSHGAIQTAAAEHSALAFALWRDTMVDSGIFGKWIANLGRKNARSHMAHLLCEMGIRMELAGLGSRTSYRLPITQTQLADTLGLTPVHVNRTLRALRTEK